MIDLGNNVKDKLTGFEGVVVGRAEYTSGHTSYQVASRTLQDGVPKEVWIDGYRIEDLGAPETDE